MQNKLIIKNARENNLKNIDLELPKNKMIVFTGVSGSGKSSLAFDTIYAEGKRRYMESLSSYVRQFLGQMDKPKVDKIEGLSPSVSIDQKTISRNPRSTVGTVTEIYDYLRLLYAGIGKAHCPVCKKEIKAQSVDEIVDKILKLGTGVKISILSPIAYKKKGEFVNTFASLVKKGFLRARVDGEIILLEEAPKLEKNIKHNVDVVIDRIILKPDITERLTDSVETALSLSNGVIICNVTDENRDILFSENFSCPEHNINLPEITPRLFSFNAPIGACPKCSGLGHFIEVNPELIVPDKTLSIEEGAIRATGWKNMDAGSTARMYLEGLAKHYKFSLNVPYRDYPEKIKNIIMYGTGEERIQIKQDSANAKGVYKVKFEGIANNVKRRYLTTNSIASKKDCERFMSERTCEVCSGKRLKPEVLAVTVGDKNIFDFTCMTVRDELEFLKKLKLTNQEKQISELVLKEIEERLGFLVSVGLEYLTLSRGADTLSGGEAQRIRLATQIGSALSGVLYVLDEPSIGLHQKDNEKMLKTLEKLKNLGNTLIIVEHDEDTMKFADYIVDIGPGAGEYGGKIVAQGTVEQIKKSKESLTGQYLVGKKKIEVPIERRKGNGREIKIYGGKQNNLKNIDVSFPLGELVVVTGVSGSGKSTLVNEILYKKATLVLNSSKVVPGEHEKIDGLKYIDKVIEINQNAIGRTPRSNPATYTGVFTDIRNLFANTKASKIKGYKSGRFSFNVKGGRCEECQGDGVLKIEMHFLPDVYVKCDVCDGKRYNRETLEVKYRGKNIADVLNMSVDEACEFFKNQHSIYRKLDTLRQVGLGYIKLGQSATTLSGGEAQRVKLATELSKVATGNTLYILDEPTTGLHIDDVKKLIDVLQKLADSGNTIVVIEHNLDVIKNADYIIDLGPDGGDKGGEIVACGTPEEISECKKSYTGQFLKPLLK
ncbi:MAG: excinuclease ABC subunit UvrA [Clostridia bacterium]|nr:excinuclease ABC subunit UvrA [Clostridia bacterium]